MHNKFKTILGLQGAVVLFSLTSVFSKKASEFEFLSVEYLFYYGAVLFIMFLYAIVWQQILKRFPLNIAYANKGTLPLITMVWGALLFNEKITIPMIIGSIIIIFGVGLVVSDVG